MEIILLIIILSLLKDSRSGGYGSSGSYRSDEYWKRVKQENEDAMKVRMESMDRHVATLREIRDLGPRPCPKMYDYAERAFNVNPSNPIQPC